MSAAATASAPDSAETASAPDSAAKATTAVCAPIHEELCGAKQSPLPPLVSATAVFICSLRRVTRIDIDGAINHVDADKRHTSPLLTVVDKATAAAAGFVQALTARERVGLLPHVVLGVSAFLDVAFAPRWTIPRACERGYLTMLPRLASREPADMNEHYRAHLFSKGLVRAAQRGDLPVVQWLCCEYCPSAFAWKGMEEAAVAGQLPVLQWLAAHYDYMQWDKNIMHRVAASGHLDVLQWIYTQPDHAICPPQAASDAIALGHLSALEWLLEVYPKYANECSYGIADAIRSGDIERVQRLVDLELKFDFGSLKHLSRLDAAAYSRVVYRFMKAAVQSGRLEMVQWVYRLVTTNGSVGLEPCRSSSSIDPAARLSYLDMIKWMDKSGFAGLLEKAVVVAASCGHLDFVQQFHESGIGAFHTGVVLGAAANGHLEVVKWLHKHRKESCTARLMDSAAGGGHIDIVKWFHANRIEGFTTDAMNGAAAAGHIEVVTWLHANRTEGCTTAAMDVAAARGHFEVVKWLHEHRTEGCTTAAMDGAAAAGHIEIVMWLHEHRIEGCTTQAMDQAAYSGHLEVLQWLHADRTEDCTHDAMDQAAYSGHFEVLQWLHKHRTEGCTAYATRLAAVGEHYEVLQWLADVYPDAVNIDQLIRRGQSSIGMKVLFERIKRARTAHQGTDQDAAVRHV